MPGLRPPRPCTVPGGEISALCVSSSHGAAKVQIRQHGGKIGVILNSHASSAAPRRGISFFSEPQFREAVPHRRDTRQLPSQRTRPFGLDHLTTRRELWSGRNGCSFDKFILRARGTDFSSESYVGVAKGHMLKPRPLSTGLRDLYRINIGSGPGTGSWPV